MIPLELTSGEQEFLAELCSALRSFQYKVLTEKYTDKDVEDMGSKLDGLFARYHWITPQKLDSLYDRLHRTGKNS